MKNILYELNVSKILLVISVIASIVLYKHSHLVLPIVFLVILVLGNRYLDIKLIEKNQDDKLESIDQTIKEIKEHQKDSDAKLAHLLSKDTVKDLMSGLSNKR